MPYTVLEAGVLKQHLTRAEQKALDREIPWCKSHRKARHIPRSLVQGMVGMGKGRRRLALYS
eukprot:6484520-Amphidinium_carterae.1